MIKNISKPDPKKSQLYFFSETKDLGKSPLKKDEQAYIQNEFKKNKTTFFVFNRLNRFEFVQLRTKKENTSQTLENCRQTGDSFYKILEQNKISDIRLVDFSTNRSEMIAFLEGLCLSAYSYKKHKSKPSDFQIKEINLSSPNISAKEIEQLNITLDAVFQCRDLVNEPHIFQNAEALAASFSKMGKESGVKVDVFNKTKIISLKMGGLLGVNKGSVDAPSFTVMEYKPAKAKNKKPIVLVGKGIVFDTGGINLKPGNYMDAMKDDMTGAATMASVICAVAEMKLPLHVIALLPTTDNRPSGNCLVPGDVITYADGTTVEITNTDAEGRLILADALLYAKKYKPQLVIDAATLTGAASRAIGKHGIVAMQVKAEKEILNLQEIGRETYERVVEFPMWDEYKESLKSDVADMQNSGGIDAGMITAGKFLEHFTDYPYIHLDIAGVAYATSKHKYYGIGGTGYGVRLLINYLKSL